jgi:acyl carrier protein
MSTDASATAGTDRPDYDSVLKTVREIVAARLEIDLDAAQPDTKLLDLPGADSLKLLQGVVAIEEVFDVTIDPDRGAAVQTIGEVADLVCRSLPAGGAAQR